MKSSPILISGAGPAGLAAATVLAKEGRPVEVHERAIKLGSRFQGDLHGVENWTGDIDWSDELASMKIDRNFRSHAVSSLVISNGRTTRTLDFPRPLFYLVERGTGRGALEQSLSEQAQAAGAILHMGSTLAPEDADIAAVGPRPGEAFVIEKGIRFRTSSPDQSAALVGREVAARGYAYLLIRDGWGCLCTVLFDHFERARSCLEASRKLFESLFNLELHDVEETGGVGSFSMRTKYQANGTLFAGESSGVQDLVFGFGIRNALAGGFLAARSLLDGKDYAQLATQRFEGALRASVVNRFLWELLAERAFVPLVSGLGNSRDPIRVLRYTHAMNPLYRLIYPLAARRMRRRYPKLLW
jgi:flavin-dependent dehydrogenase